MVKSGLDRLAQTEDIKIIWKSYELRPKNAPPLPEAIEKAYRERIAAAWPQTQQIAQDRFGVEMKSHRWGVKSRYALEGAKLAEEKGRGDAYHEAMFRAHFVDDRDFGDLETLADLAAEVGLNQAEFLTAIQSGAYATQVDADIAQAMAYGLQGVPATIIEHKYLVSGAQPYEVWLDVVQQIKQRLSEGRWRSDDSPGTGSPGYQPASEINHPLASTFYSPRFISSSSLSAVFIPPGLSDPVTQAALLALLLLRILCRSPGKIPVNHAGFPAVDPPAELLNPPPLFRSFGPRCQYMAARPALTNLTNRQIERSLIQANHSIKHLKKVYILTTILLPLLKN
jgi:predicted DsbA family dithiol-disulfide isomerase